MHKTYDELLDEIAMLTAQNRKKDSIIADLHAKLNKEHNKPKATKKALLPTVPPDKITKICKTLELFNACDEGLSYLGSQQLTASELKLIAKHYHVTGNSKLGLKLEERIVKVVVGAKARSVASLTADCLKAQGG